MGKSGPRMLKGLSLDNLLEENPEESIEQNGENEATDEKPVGRRSRRQRNDDAIYDMKYHPMDVVTRPNRAATIRHRSKSASLAMDDYGDEESSGASSASSSDEPDDEESEDEKKVNAVRPRVVLTPRTPHSRAVRHSARSEAHKQINYSTKSHPQDYALPGYKHRAPLHVPHPQVHIHSSSPHEKGGKKRKDMLPTPEDDGQIDLLSAYDNAQEEEEREPEQRRPRKKLRSINPNISSSPRPRPLAIGVTDKPLEVPDSDDEVEDDGDEDEEDGHVDDLVEMALRASQPPPRQPQALSDDNVEDTITMFLNDTPQQAPQTNGSRSDKGSSDLAGDEDEGGGKGGDSGRHHSEPQTSLNEGQVLENQITAQPSSGSLFSGQHLDGDHDDDDDDEEEQPKHDQEVKDQPTVSSESFQQPEEHFQSEDRPTGHHDMSKVPNDASDRDQQPGHDARMASRTTGGTGSSQKRSDTGSDQRPLRDSPMADDHADGTSSPQKPDDVDETDQQQYHDALTGDEHTGQSDSTTQPGDGLEGSTNLQPQAEPSDGSVTDQRLGAEVFPGSLPPQSHQPERGPTADQEDSDEYDPEDDEDSRQPSDFEEQFAITERAYKVHDSEGSFDSRLSPDPMYLLQP